MDMTKQLKKGELSRSRSASNGMSSFQRIYQTVTKIPIGKVSTYGRVAKKSGAANSRVVGFALHSNKTPDTVPCHRVVFKNGELAKGYAFGGSNIQKQLLLAEGITFVGSRINFEKYLYSF